MSLSSSDPAAAVPASVTVAQGASSATFTVTTSPVSSAKTVTISASRRGLTKTAALTVLEPAVSALTLTPGSFAGGCKSSTGKVLATTSASVPKAGGQATVTVKPADGLKRGYRAWACPTAASGADWQPCTKPVKLGGKAARLKVAVDAGEKVRVIVARRGR